MRHLTDAPVSSCTVYQVMDDVAMSFMYCHVALVRQLFGFCPVYQCKRSGLLGVFLPAAVKQLVGVLIEIKDRAVAVG